MGIPEFLMKIPSAKNRHAVVQALLGPLAAGNTPEALFPDPNKLDKMSGKAAFEAMAPLATMFLPAENVSPEALRMAKELKEAGIPPEEIWKRTYKEWKHPVMEWQTNVPRQESPIIGEPAIREGGRFWVSEISDEALSRKPMQQAEIDYMDKYPNVAQGHNTGMYDYMLSHPELERFNPTIHNTRVETKPSQGGSFDYLENKVTIPEEAARIRGLIKPDEYPSGRDFYDEVRSRNKWNKAAKNTTAHELQHRIQAEHDWPRGGSPREFVDDRQELENVLSRYSSTLKNADAYITENQPVLENLRKAREGRLAAVGDPYARTEWDIQIDLLQTNLDRQKRLSDMARKAIEPVRNALAKGTTIEGKPLRTANEKYLSLAGENMAYTTGKRVDLTMPERGANYPAPGTEFGPEYGPQDEIVRMQGLEYVPEAQSMPQHLLDDYSDKGGTRMSEYLWQQEHNRAAPPADVVKAAEALKQRAHDLRMQPRVPHEEAVLRAKSQQALEERQQKRLADILFRQQWQNQGLPESVPPAGPRVAYDTFEATPGAGTGHLDEITNLPMAQKQAYAAEPGSSWKTPEGGDALYEAMGFKTRPTIAGVGEFQGPQGLEFNPNFAAKPEMPFANEQALQTGNAMRAYFDAQNAGAWNMPANKQQPGVIPAWDLPGSESGYFDYQDVIGKENQGQGKATARLLEALQQGGEYGQAVEQSPALQEIVGQKIARDEKWGRYLGKAPREDIQLARKLYKEGGMPAIRKALKEGALLPAVLLAMDLKDVDNSE